ncbi:MAG: hypothetical protein U0T73_11870 [Chitinophagales bacterium]
MKGIVLWCVIFLCGSKCFGNFVSVTQSCTLKPIKFDDLRIDSIVPQGNQTIRYYFKTEQEPRRIILFLDTISATVFPFWIEKDKNVEIEISNCSLRHINFLNPDSLNILEFETFLFYQFFTELPLTQHKFDSIYEAHLVYTARSNLSSYFALHYINILVLQGKADLAKELFDRVAPTLHQYALYATLKNILSSPVKMTPLKKGVKLPNFQVYISDSNKLELGSFGRNKLLIFSKIGCRPCEDVKRRIKDEHFHDIDIFIYSLDDWASWRKYSKEFNEGHFYFVNDINGENSLFIRQYGIRSVPAYLLLNSANEILEYNYGLDEYESIRDYMISRGLIEQ